MNCQAKRSVPLATVLLVLAGCGDTQPEPVATETEAAAPMAGMETSATPIMANGTGTITAIDTEAGKITLDHAAIPEAEWPAMTMGFSADSTLLGDLQVGDEVTFDVEITGTAGKITSISKQ